MKQKLGFSLVEILVVIAILGILSAIGITYYGGVQAQARDGKRKSDMRTFAASLLNEHSTNEITLPVADPAIAVAPDWGPVWFGEDASQSSLRVVAETAGVALPNSPLQGVAGTINDYWYVSDPLGESFAVFTKLETKAQNWFVVNNLGFSDEVANTSGITTLPSRSPVNVECVQIATGTVAFSPCAGSPLIQ